VTLRAVAAWQFPHLGLLPMAGSALPAIEEKMGEEIELEIQAIAARVSSGTGVGIDVEMAVGPAAQMLLRALDGADLVVVGNRGRGGFTRLLLGSVAHQLATHARRPTIIVPEGTDSTPLTRVVVGVDGSENSKAALKWAHGFAPAASELVAVGVWEPPRLFTNSIDADVWTTMRDVAYEQLAETLAQVEQSLGLRGRFTPVFEVGDARTHLLDHAAEADLLVVGERGHRGILGGVLGSVATWAIHHLACPTAVIPAPGTTRPCLPDEADE
jgi:nucleotide-binding universal stress UspA family protein